MTKFPAGTVTWANDPTEARSERPVVVLSHEKRPFSAVQCTVLCLGTGANEYEHYAPELEDQHLSEISFDETTYVMPWALYTIPPGAIRTAKPQGELTNEGERLIKKALISLFNV